MLKLASTGTGNRHAAFSLVPLVERDEYLSLDTGVSLTYESKLSGLGSQTDIIQCFVLLSDGNEQ
jgi:hypothetical protein